MSLAPPAFQFDIAGALTGVGQGLTAVGLRGAKYLAEGNVHPHTIASMVSMGQVVPATQKFRKEVQDLRQEQRRKSKFKHRAMEIGAGVNYLADVLLLDRAGENILCLPRMYRSFRDGGNLCRHHRRIVCVLQGEARRDPKHNSTAELSRRTEGSCDGHKSQNSRDLLAWCVRKYVQGSKLRCC